MSGKVELDRNGLESKHFLVHEIYHLVIVDTNWSHACALVAALEIQKAAMNGLVVMLERPKNGH